MFSFIGKTGKRILPAGKAPESEKRKERQTARKQVSLSSFLPVASRGMSSSTVANYQTAVRSFIRFGGGRDMPLSGIDCRLVARYERWLRENGVCPNTSSCYLRSLRAIYNKAVAHRKVKDKNPFRNAFTGNDRTVKRSIGAPDLRACRPSNFPKGPHRLLSATCSSSRSAPWACPSPTWHGCKRGRSGMACSPIAAARRAGWCG